MAEAAESSAEAQEAQAAPEATAAKGEAPRAPRLKEARSTTEPGPPLSPPARFPAIRRIPRPDRRAPADKAAGAPPAAAAQLRARPGQPVPLEQPASWQPVC